MCLIKLSAPPFTLDSFDMGKVVEKKKKHRQNEEQQQQHLELQSSEV